jgi:maltose O-acetyltransferase
MIGSHTAISTVTHDFEAAIMYGTIVTGPIEIDDDVWIGTHAVVLPNVRIGKGAVVGAGSVVTRTVPSNAIVLGVPARVVKYRMTIPKHENGV